MSRPQPHSRADYAHFRTIPTRWADNDVYGHVNNSVYYFYFDTAVNRWLMERGLLDIVEQSVIGLAVENMCRFFAPVAFPEDIHAGLRVGHIGNSSVRYELGLFTEGNGDAAVAQGHFVHVYVDEATRRPVPLSASMREALETLRR